MKRRVIAALLTLTMVFSLTACGGSKSDSSKDSSKKEEKEATVETLSQSVFGTTGHPTLIMHG